MSYNTNAPAAPLHGSTAYPPTSHNPYGVTALNDVQSVSAVSWGAIFAGASAAAALSLILLILGTGLGMASASPWADRGADAGTLGVAGIIWITVTGLIASGVGGYIAGRLRTKWTGIHTDEVYFRDTAHGFLAWAVATLFTAGVLTSAIGAIAGAGVQAGAAVAGGAATVATATAAGAATAGANANDRSPGNGAATYYVNALFRKAADAPSSNSSAAAAPTTGTPQDMGQTAAEVTTIFGHSLATGQIPQDDVRYVGQLVSQQTGLSQADAEKRVTDTFNQIKQSITDAAAKAKEVADKARKASAYTAMWLFISLLIAAFSGSLAATWGGRRRDL